MRRRKFPLLLLVLVLSTVLLFGFAAFGAQDSDGDGVPNGEDKYPGRNDLKYGGTLTLARAEEPVTLDGMRTSYGDQAHQYVSEPALMFSPQGKFGPAGWVKSFTQSQDETKLTFEIKKGITFHDGTELDAEAFAWLLRKRIKEDDIYSLPLNNVPGPEGVKVLDEYTVQINQTKPFPELPKTLAAPDWTGAIQVPRAVKKYGEDYGKAEAYGNGPFKFEEWVKRDHLTLTRYEKYDWTPSWAWKYSDSESPEDYVSGPPYIKKLVLKYVPEASSRVNMLKTGAIDGIIEVPKSKVEQLENMEDVKVMTQPSYRIKYIGYNTTAAPLDELQVRKALNYAVNRKALAQVAYYGYANPAYSLYAGKPLETENTLHLYKYDPNKAENMLEEAGWVDSDNDGFREKDGTELSFNLMTRKASDFSKMASVIQSMWRNVGVKANVRTYDASTVRSRIEEKKHEAIIHQHEWVTKQDMYPWWFNPEYAPYPYESLMTTDKMKELNEEALAATTMTELKKEIDDLVNHYYEKAALCALVRPVNLLAMSTNVKNAVPSHKEGGDWRWAPYLWDTYKKSVYQENKEEFEG